MTTTVRIDERSRDVLRELAKEVQLPMRDVLAEAIEQHYRRWILERSNEVWAAMRADPDLWQTELDERAVTEGTLLDDLDDE